MSEECAPPTNPLIWDVLAHLLTDRGSSTDTVVRLTAATALKDCMDVRIHIIFFGRVNTPLRLDRGICCGLLPASSPNNNQ